MLPTNSEYERSIKEMANEAPLKEKGAVCLYDGAPCFRLEQCFVPVGDFRFPYFVCSRVRFKGCDSVIDRGLGMTVHEKLKRAGLLPDEFR